MDNDLVTYIEHLELMAFFAGYPLVYAAIQVVGGKQMRKPGFAKHFVGLLSYAYALTATLFFGLVIKDITVNYSTNNPTGFPAISYLKIWGCLGVACWIPFVAKRPFISLVHSSVFFFLLLKDIFSNQASSGDIIRNDMKIYTDSVLLNTGSFMAIAVISYLFSISTRKKAAGKYNHL